MFRVIVERVDPGWGKGGRACWRQIRSSFSAGDLAWYLWDWYSFVPALGRPFFAYFGAVFIVLSLILLCFRAF